MKNVPLLEAEIIVSRTATPGPRGYKAWCDDSRLIMVTDAYGATPEEAVADLKAKVLKFIKEVQAIDFESVNILNP